MFIRDSTQAGDGLQREQHIIGSLASFLKTEVAAKTFHDRGGFPNVTSCSVTDFENVFPLRFKRKVFIEARNTVGAGVCDADFFGEDVYKRQVFSAPVASCVYQRHGWNLRNAALPIL